MICFQKDNFINNLNYLLPFINKIPVYTLEQYKNIDPNHEWPGCRSKNLCITEPFLWAYLENLIMQLNLPFLRERQWNVTSYLHLRREEDNNKEWIHVDDEGYSFLIYLNETNLSSGTKMFDQNHKEINDFKYVKNRMICFNSLINHVGYGHFGKNMQDGRTTINIFFKPWKR